MRRRIRRVAATALVALTAVLVTGCSDDAPSAGPLRYDGTHQVVCVDNPTRHRLVLGVPVQAPPHQTVELQRVRLTGAHGMRLTAAYLLPIGSTGFIGSDDYPPTEQTWRQRRPLAGGRLPGNRSGNVLIVVTQSTAVAATRALRIDYSIGGDRYSKTGTTAFRLAPHCD